MRPSQGESVFRSGTIEPPKIVIPAHTNLYTTEGNRASTAAAPRAVGKDDSVTSRPLTSYPNPRNRDYSSGAGHQQYHQQQHVSGYRNYGGNNAGGGQGGYHHHANTSTSYGNNIAPPQSGGYQQHHQQQQQQQQFHHRPYGLQGGNNNNQNVQSGYGPRGQPHDQQSGLPHRAGGDYHPRSGPSMDGEPMPGRLQAPERMVKRWIPQNANDSESFTTEDRNNAVFRHVRGILNKITPDNFHKLSDDLLQAGLDSSDILKGVIMLIFNKALEEPKYSSMYAQLCRKLSEGVPNFDNPPPAGARPGEYPNTFCRFLLRKCEAEFNSRCSDSEAFGEGPLGEEEEELRDQAKKKMLGNIKFICELGKQNLADEFILHRCIQQLCKKKVDLKNKVEDLECLCQIMKTVGRLLDTEKGKTLMNQYFDRVEKYAMEPELPKRNRFMLQDVLDLRKNKWVSRNIQRDQNPKTIHQIREEANRDYSFLQPGGGFTPAAPGYQSMMSGNQMRSSNYFGGTSQRALDDMASNMPSFGNSMGQPVGSFMLDPDLSPGFATGLSPSSSNNSNKMPFNPNFNTGLYQKKNLPGKDQESGDIRSLGNSQNPREQPYGSGERLKGDVSTNNRYNRPSSGDDQQPPIQPVREIQPRRQIERPDYNKDQLGDQQQQDGYNNRNNLQRPNNYDPLRNNVGKYQPNYNNNRIPLQIPGDRQFQPPNQGNYNKPMNQPPMIRDQQAGNRELPPRFQRMQLQQQQQQQQHGQYQPPNMYQGPNQPPLYAQQGQPRNYQPNNEYQTNPAGNMRSNYNNQVEGNNYPGPQRVIDIRPGQGRIGGNISGPGPNMNHVNNPPPPKPYLPMSGGFAMMDSREISLRPARNSLLKPMHTITKPSFEQDQQASNDQQRTSLDERRTENSSAQSLPDTSASDAVVKQSAPEPVPKEQLKDLVSKISNEYLDKTTSQEDTVKAIEKLHAESKHPQAEILRLLMERAAERDEADREKTSELLVALKTAGLVNEFGAALGKLLGRMQVLEVDVPKIKSITAAYVARAVAAEIISLPEAFKLSERYYPLFLLCLQQLNGRMGQEWLQSQFEQSNIDLMHVLPECDRNKERLCDTLKDRGLSFLQPLLRIESDLQRLVSGQSGQELTPASFYRWIKDNVDTKLQQTTQFIVILFTAIAKLVSERCDSSITDEDTTQAEKKLLKAYKQFLSKYGQILQSFLLERQDLQLSVLYALQTYSHSLGFPKGLVLRWFILLYELDIVDGEVFLKWKEEVNDDYPDKGRALFQVNVWLTWLEKAEQDDEEDEDEEEDA